MNSNLHATAGRVAGKFSKDLERMFEAEIKYRTDSRKMAEVEEAARALALGPPVAERYEDAYFDDAAGRLEASGGELRVRERRLESTGESAVILTFKDAPFDAASRSKPEWETLAGDAGTLRDIFTALGMRETSRFIKHCLNFSVAWQGMRYELTFARLDGLEGAFLEIERQCATREEALLSLSGAEALAQAIGLASGELCPSYYTDMVRKRLGAPKPVLASFCAMT